MLLLFVVFLASLDTGSVAFQEPLPHSREERQPLKSAVTTGLPLRSVDYQDTHHGLYLTYSEEKGGAFIGTYSKTV